MSSVVSSKKLPHRGTSVELERRRQQVFKLLLRGVPQTTIADMLGVHRNTVIRDITNLKDKLRDRAKNPDVYLEIGQMAEAFDEIAKLSLIEFTSTKDPKIKNIFLNTSLRAIASKGDLLIKTGVLPSAAQKIKLHADLSTEVRLDDRYEPMRPILEDPARRRKVLGLFERLISIGGREVLQLEDQTRILDAAIKGKNEPATEGEEETDPEDSLSDDFGEGD